MRLEEWKFIFMGELNNATFGNPLTKVQTIKLQWRNPLSLTNARKNICAFVFLSADFAFVIISASITNRSLYIP